LDRQPDASRNLPPLTALPAGNAVAAMSDGVGILQRAHGPVPDRRGGYSLDDNVRALLLMARTETLAVPERRRLAATYASFVQRAWDEERQVFRAGMNHDRSWREHAGSEESAGRAAWVLGELLASPLDEAWGRWAAPWFDRALAAVADTEAPRTIAFAMLGASAVLRAGLAHDGALALLERGGDLLHRLLATERRPDWAWFEAVLGHDNPRMPQALLEAGVVLEREDWREAGLESLAWIAKQQRASSGHFRPVGSESAEHAYTLLPFDQQPLEAWAAIEAAASAYAVTGDRQWLEHATIAHRWFFGGNDRGVVLGDLASGRCRDGITPRGANENCGAESILAFQLACHAAAALARAANVSQTGDRVARTAPSTVAAAATFG
jgi:hypothetical protein